MIEQIDDLGWTCASCERSFSRFETQPTGYHRGEPLCEPCSLTAHFEMWQDFSYAEGTIPGL